MRLLPGRARHHAGTPRPHALPRVPGADRRAAARRVRAGAPAATRARASSATTSASSPPASRPTRASTPACSTSSACCAASTPSASTSPTLDVRQHADVLHAVLAQGFDDPQLADARQCRAARGRWRRRWSATAARSTELDALGKRTLGGLRCHRAGTPPLRPRGHRLLHRQRRHGRGRCARGPAAGALGRGLRQAAAARWRSTSRRSSRPRTRSSGCGETLRTLLADPLYRRHLEARGRRQCVLIGYSDSNKERGPCASRVAIHQAQRDLAQVLGSAGEQHVLFHARGGSMARGGGRIEAIVRAAPAGAVDGVLRIREQGETVKQGYGLRPIAMRTLERAFNALSLTTAARRSGRLPPDDAGHLELAALLATASACRLPAPGVRGAAVLRVLPGGDADRRDRAHADRRALACTAPRAPASRRCCRCRGCSPGRRRATCCPAGSAPARASPPRSSAWGWRACARRAAAGSSCATSSTTSRPCWHVPISTSRSYYETLAPAGLRRFGRRDPRRVRARLRAGAGDQAASARCSTPTRPCSARSGCATRTSIR